MTPAALSPIFPSHDVFQGGGELGGLMRSHDWSTTPLGPPESWPRSLQSVVRMMLTSRYQMWMGWGAELTFFCNDAYRPTLGVKYPWAIGQSARQVWTEIWPDIGPLIDQVLRTGEATYSEGMLLILQRSGFPEETYHTFSYSPLFDDTNAIAGMFCVVVEETERVITERRMATLRKLASATATTRSEQELFAAVSAELGGNASDLPFTLTYLFDEDRTTARLAARSGIGADHAAAQASLTAATSPWPFAPILANTPSTLVDNLPKQFADLPRGAWDKPPRTALIVPIAQPAHDRGPAGFMVVGLNPYRPLDPSYVGFIDLLAGQIAAALSAARAYEQERMRAEALAEIDRAKTAFFSNVSHEFRTPLTLMLGPLEEALAQPAGRDDPQRHQIELAHRNGMRLLRLVNSLLDFSRIEAGRVQATYVPTDLPAFSSEIASSFRSTMEKAGLTLTVTATALPDLVCVDRDMWEKILLNLLSNAFKFTFTGGISVATTASEDGRFALTRVSDTGIGIAAEELPRLFERFHRVEGAQGRSFEGSGIGLALVQELVHLHGGSIAVESALGSGTTFTVRLPIGSAHLPKDKIRSKPAAVKQSIHAHAFIEEALRWLDSAEDTFGGAADLVASEVGADAGPGAGKRVLLADDNADMRDYVRRLLIAQGYEVEAVTDGAEALAAARRRAPDLVLSDVMMPRLDGFGLLRGIRGDAALASTPVILLSARAGEEAKVEGLDAGADDYLIKPFAARELLARVAGNIQMARIRRDAAREVMRSEQRFLMTRERLGLALSTGRIAVFEVDIATATATVLGPLTQFFGVSEQGAAAGLPLSTFIDGIHPDDRARVNALIAQSIASGESYEAEYRLIGGSAEKRVVARGSVQTSATGERRLLGALIDISEEKAAEDALRERTRALAILNRTGSHLAAELDLGNVVQTVVDAGVELTGAKFGAFFYNVLDQDGESYMLYALSGAPIDAFANFPMPRKTAVFGPTFLGEGLVRSDDITRDPRYGQNAPRHGMPAGHLPVRSYLAVPVKSRTGEVLGGLFFGHELPAVFGERAEDIMRGLSAQAAVAIDNARLFQAAQQEIKQRRAAEEKLQAINATLEERVTTEVASRLSAEEALRQAQKMEAVGQLTGGVAHDFNNLLTVIIGGLDIIRRSGPTDNARLTRALDMATQGAHRAATLTARLLAFSRRQPLEPKPLDLNGVVRDSTELLHRTLGETIELEVVLSPRLWRVEVDQNQLESAILNLAVNARDAMPSGGKLTIETGNTLLDEAYAESDSEVVPGQYVALSISDDGTGMSKAVLDRVFEPFYTTKEVGKGTGLGLSMVYGFVKQSGGHVTVYSEEGQGTTVRMYFPRYRGGDREDAAPSSDSQSPKGHRDEVILVVEDNDEVRDYSVAILTELGYNVLEAVEADAALAILKRPGRIDLLFTDVVLPGKTGRVLADEAVKVRPGLRVLFTTGYSRNAIVHQGRLDPGVNLITKPFSFEQLAVRIRDALDR